METVSGTNRWSLNRGHKRPFSFGRRNRRWRKAYALLRLAPARNPRRCASREVRLPLPAYCEIPCRECRSDTALTALLADIFRCRASSGDMLSVRTSCKVTGRNRKTSEHDDCLDIGGHRGRTGALAESPAVVRRRFVPSALANPFNVEPKAFWPKCKNELKSKTTIISHNLLCLCDLHQYPKTLTGQ